MSGGWGGRAAGSEGEWDESNWEGKVRRSMPIKRVRNEGPDRVESVVVVTKGLPHYEGQRVAVRWWYGLEREGEGGWCA